MSGPHKMRDAQAPLGAPPLADELPSSHALSQAFSQAGRVLVVGDVMLDRFAEGHVSRISPEAPIPILRLKGEHAMLGGAGNVARNLAELGVKVALLGIIGEDSAGKTTQKLRISHGIDGALIPKANRPTTVKLRYRAQGQQLLRVDHETNIPITAADVEELLGAAATFLPDSAVIILSDYAKGVLTPALLTRLIDAGKKAGCLLLADPKIPDWHVYQGVDLLTPNRQELAAASGLRVTNDAEVTEAARIMLERCGLSRLLVTRSEQGLSLITPNQAWHIPASTREVYDVSGAGDTVIATFAMALASLQDWPIAAALSNLAGGIVVGKSGTASLTRSELLQAWRSSTEPDHLNKSMSLEELLPLISRWRAQGLRIGFTNGCFDLLHPGHVNLLYAARQACDRLIVGLNSDASIKRLKGESRPIQPAAARQAVLGALSSVSQIVLFDEDTPLRLITAIRPDILVKGADYQHHQVVGHDIVQAYGGQVVLVPLTVGQSTTAMVTRLQQPPPPASDTPKNQTTKEDLLEIIQRITPPSP
jgi:D-beta-D-heptose 7-phosphate kinase / D-beta-D-heptose 1-phosphate adenosyltransferase